MASASPNLTLNDFHFCSMDSTEEIPQYIPGGYHPIAIGDILGTNDSCRYRIMHKLGYGSYSTVWLAQKTDSSNSFVAVKITMAEVGQSLEAAMLEAASRQVQSNSEQRPGSLALLDHFTLEGPNGSHSVLMTDIVVPIFTLQTRCPGPWRRATTHGLVQAIADLHAAGIVESPPTNPRSNLHVGNLGFAFPQLSDQDPEVVMQELSPYELTIVLPTTAVHQTASLPSYVVMPCNITAYYLKLASSDPPLTKVLDFGAAHNVGTPSPSFQCAWIALAPAVAFAIKVEKVENPTIDPAADIWALGTAIFEIVTGSPIFYLTSLPYAMLKVADVLPPGWENWYANLSDPPGVSCRERVRRTCTDDADADMLSALLRKILALDPALRCSAVEIVDDPWFKYST
ncbi:kinase-like protein [Gymnopilus junonius]|uniref:non-specific serine/threonine protein kinase n=1 Tax=Gymnopilus junonius TaxID=109634 RepID=A0A9P5N6U9_GYMJU|nr:kinase-like protein [Gymnopilus junonius]